MEVSDERELLHSKIIRDADKTDIIYMLVFENKETAWGSNYIEKETMTDEIYQEFIKEKAINYQKRKTSVDVLVSHFAYVFDFEYEYAIQMVKEKEYFDKIYQRFRFQDKQTQERINEIYKITKKYLEER